MRSSTSSVIHLRHYETRPWDVKAKYKTKKPRQRKSITIPWFWHKHNYSHTHTLCIYTSINSCMYVTAARFQPATKQKKNYHKSKTNKKRQRLQHLRGLKTTKCQSILTNLLLLYVEYTQTILSPPNNKCDHNCKLRHRNSHSPFTTFDMNIDNCHFDRYVLCLYEKKNPNQK